MALLDNQRLGAETFPSGFLSNDIIMEHCEEMNKGPNPAEPGLSPFSSLTGTHNLLQDDRVTTTDQETLRSKESTFQKSPVSGLDYGRYPLHDARRRKLHVLIAGAGPSGIAMAIKLMKLEHVTFEIHEKNADVGGTWLENRYPGAACDVASHAYQYTFEQNTEWSHQ
jgi:hypothetical protein